MWRFVFFDEKPWSAAAFCCRDRCQLHLVEPAPPPNDIECCRFDRGAVDQLAIWTRALHGKGSASFVVR